MDNTLSDIPKNAVLVDECKVSQNGTIHPCFSTPNGKLTSGLLKYFGAQNAGRRVKVTVEFLD